MKIGIDLQCLSDRRTGIGNYAFNLVNALLDLKTEHEWVLFTPTSSPPISLSETGGEREGVKIVKLPVKRWPFWTSHITYARIMREQKLDVLHGVANTIPLFYPLFVSPYARGRSKVVITVHDLAIYKHPEWFPKGQWLATKIVVPQSIKKADKIIVPSEITKKDLIELFKAPEEKIAVIPEGVEPRFFKSDERTANSEQGGETSHRPSSIAHRYILFVGTLEPRKNLPRVIEAYEGLPAELKNEYELWIVGGKSDLSLGPSPSPGEGIRFFDYVADEELPGLYQNTSLFVYPSLYEGFGLPVLEAMAGGCPVITSKDSAMAEILTRNFEVRNSKHEALNPKQISNSKELNSKRLGFENSNLDIVSDFGFRISNFLVDPYSVDEIRGAMERVLREKGNVPRQARDLRGEKGIRLAREFTWEKTARETLAVYEKI